MTRGRLNQTPEKTWQAEERANRNLVEQETWAVTAEHRCGNCYGPFGLSAIKCKNAGGA